MKAGVFLLAAAALTAGLSPRAIDAQAKATASGPGTFTTVGGGYSGFQIVYGQRILGGAVAWADVNPTWRYGIEGEVRFLRYNSDEGVTETNYFVGPKVSITRPERSFQPYGKFLVGAGVLTFPFGGGQDGTFAMAPGAGVDFRVNDRWSIRAVDFEYQFWRQFLNKETLKPYGLTAGVSFRLNGIDRYPKSKRPWRK